VAVALLAAAPFLTRSASAVGAVAAGARAPRAVVGLVPSPRADVTRAVADGLRLALDEAREAGGADLALAIGPGGSAWSTAAGTAADLSTLPGVVALVTPPERRLAHPVAQLGTRAQVPVVSTSSAASVLATGSTWVVGVVPTLPAAPGASGGEDDPPSFDPTAPAARSFVTAYQARHGVEPAAWAAVGYEAGRRLALASGRAGRRGAELAAALAASAGGGVLERDPERGGVDASPATRSAAGGSSR
jgi:hypothetical protein